MKPRGPIPEDTLDAAAVEAWSRYIKREVERAARRHSIDGAKLAEQVYPLIADMIRSEVGAAVATLNKRLAKLEVEADARADPTGPAARALRAVKP